MEGSIDGFNDNSAPLLPAEDAPEPLMNTMQDLPEMKVLEPPVEIVPELPVEEVTAPPPENYVHPSVEETPELLVEQETVPSQENVLDSSVENVPEPVVEGLPAPVCADVLESSVVEVPERLVEEEGTQVMKNAVEPAVETSFVPPSEEFNGNNVEHPVEEPTGAPIDDAFVSWGDAEDDWNMAQDVPPVEDDGNFDNSFQSDANGPGKDVDSGADVDWFSSGQGAFANEESDVLDGFDIPHEDDNFSNPVEEPNSFIDVQLEDRNGQANLSQASHAAVQKEESGALPTHDNTVPSSQPVADSFKTDAEVISPQPEPDIIPELPQNVSPPAEAEPPHEMSNVFSSLSAPSDHVSRFNPTTTSDVPRETISWNEDSSSNIRYTETAELTQERLEISSLQEQIQHLTFERDNIFAEKGVVDRGNDELELSVLQLRDTLARKEEQILGLVHQQDTLRHERDDALEEKLLVEKERDSAVERGGVGLREARNAIESMRNSHDTAEKREVVISKQIEALREDLDNISHERNNLISEAEALRSDLRDTESHSRIREDGLNLRLQAANNMVEIANLEKDKALEANRLQAEEYNKLVEIDYARSASLSASHEKIRELESYIASSERDREDESLRIEVFSSQIEEMKERTRGVIEERNLLYNEKVALERQISSSQLREEQLNRDLLDSRRESSSIASERNDIQQSVSVMRDQNEDMAKRYEVLCKERNRLIQERSATAASSSSFSEKGKALAQECEQKTKAVAILQRKLTSAIAKIEKLTLQRGTFQRQRDDAGKRLREAAEEFFELKSQSADALHARDILQEQVIQIRDERDDAISRVEEQKEISSQKKIVEGKLESKLHELEETQTHLKECRDEVANMRDEICSLQQKCTSLSTQVSESGGKYEVAVKEKEFLLSQKEALDSEKVELQKSILETLSSNNQLKVDCKSMEVELTTLKEKSALDLGIASAKMISEQKASKELNEKLLKKNSEMELYTSFVSDIRELIFSLLRQFKSQKNNESLGTPIVWPEVDETLDGPHSLKPMKDLFSTFCNMTMQLNAEWMSISGQFASLQQEHSTFDKAVLTIEEQRCQLQESQEELLTVRANLEETQSQLQAVDSDKRAIEMELQELNNRLTVSVGKEADLQARLEMLAEQMKQDAERGAQISSEEVERLKDDLGRMSTNLKSIWAMLQKTLVSQHIDAFADDPSVYEELMQSENVAVLVLRATASVVTELSRTSSEEQELKQKLVMVEAEATRLIDRAEIAEQERDAVRGSNERLERKAGNAYAEGQEETQLKYETAIGNVEEELDEARQEVVRFTEKASRSEKEASELRALCSKLTSQFNGRTNELDEAEEKVVYLQDQVTTLEEDLEEAHASLRQREEETAEARKSDVDRLTAQLEEKSMLLERTETECVTLREECDKAKNLAREMEVISDRHEQAEENLQIAIEQLEAGQESLVEQRTIELQKKLKECEANYEAAVEREASVKVKQHQLSNKDDEIMELRGALGRLADERVELKLELEKNLSRLNHPDAGGELVDRRVVRQLLVSYFRVGSVRRRDVLGLMSRMLAFSESDNLAVGLKRRALMDRLGSLVQAPDLDDASLPPLGTVSDKWIEFLMKETEEGDEQAKGW